MWRPVPAVASQNLNSQGLAIRLSPAPGPYRLIEAAPGEAAVGGM